MPTVKVENLFGLSRFGRGQPVELANIVNAIPVEKWIDCGPTLDACLGTQAEAIQAQNRKPEPSLCGSLTVVEVSPTPWAYRDLTELHFEANKAMGIEVQCD